MLVPHLCPVEAKRIAATVGQEAGERVQGGAHGAARRVAQPAEIDGGWMTGERARFGQGQRVVGRGRRQHQAIVGDGRRRWASGRVTVALRAETSIFISYPCSVTVAATLSQLCLPIANRQVYREASDGLEHQRVSISGATSESSEAVAYLARVDTRFGQPGGWRRQLPAHLVTRARRNRYVAVV